MVRAIILIFIMVVGLEAAMSQKDLAIAIDHSVRQNVRIHKILKEALLIKMGIDVKENAKRMQFTTKMLNSDLDAFLGRKKSNIPAIQDKEILEKIKAFEKEWKEVEKRAKAIYTLQYSNKDIEYLVAHNNSLLEKSQAVVQAIVKKHKEDSDLKFAHDIKIAGKQRELTQRISKDILMYLNDINKTQALRDLKKIEELNRNFKALLYGDKELGCVGVKLPNIVAKLKAAQQSWNEAKPLIAKALKKKETKVTKDIIDKLDAIRVQMREAVLLYTKSLNREKKYLALEHIKNNFYNKTNKTKQLINLAGKQRMLTQRMAKLAIECAYNLRKNSCKELEEDRKLFGAVLKLFERASKKGTFEPELFKAVQGDVEKITKVWSSFEQNSKALAQSEGRDKEALKRLLADSDALLSASDELVNQMLQYYKKELTSLEQTTLRIINLAGKTRMLSQKMTKEYLEKNILHNSQAKEELKKSVKLYNLILEILEQGNRKLKIPKVTDFKIKKQLQQVHTLWSKLQPHYLKDNPSKKEIHLILLANPILLEKMDKSVKLITQTTEY